MKPEILVALCVGFLPYLVNAVLWLANSEKKRYAAQRDFEHLKNNQKEISNGIASLGDDIDDYFNILNRDILEIKVKLGIELSRLRNIKNNDDS